MRLKPAKVDYLSHKVTLALKAMNKMEFLQTPDQVEGIIRRVIIDDLKREDEVEKEAEEILRNHKMAIDRQNMSYNTLMSRAKQQIARKKKIVL